MKREHRISLLQEGIGRQEAARNDLLGIFGVVKTSQSAERTQSGTCDTVVGDAERMPHKATVEISKSPELSSDTTHQSVVSESDEVLRYSDEVAIRESVAYGAGVMGMRSAQLDPLESTPSGAYAEIDPTSEFTRAA